ncbi:arrestin domain-containing protein 3-like [Hyalella azteca]|uniref:Arrestin domain-containing protein 3-like n=1 Tax=Hyalella azteca TaxID=294128 RepID=A0A8B7PGF9_HYAAZ|nr:arrestin domain-containing protein 3-like [Hyalella azteca]
MAPRIALLMDQPTLVYFPGQTITGHVQVQHKSKIKCKTLSIGFIGTAAVSFSTSETTRDHNGKHTTHHRTHSAQERYYESQMQLWADPSQEMAPGPTKYPFSFLLPINIPPSFVGAHGKVMHEMTIKLESTKMFKDIKLTQPYSVNSLVDLNLNPTARMTQQQHQEKALCCWCCKSGPLSVMVHLNKTGYVPGESILIDAEIENNTKSKITACRAKLRMNVCYKADLRMQIESRTLSKITKPQVTEVSELSWNSEKIQIPPTPASPLPFCNIIDIEYQMKFFVSLQGINPAVEMTFPITVGTIPTVDAFPVATIPSMAMNFPYPPGGGQPSTSAAGGFATMPGLEQYPQIPPPTYQQAMATSDHVQSSGGQSAPYKVDPEDNMAPSAPPANFTPYYVSYNFQDTSQPQYLGAGEPEKKNLP